MAEASTFLRVSFAALAVLLAAAFALGVYFADVRSGLGRGVALRHGALAALGAVAWLAASGLVAVFDVLSLETVPPTWMLLPSTMASLMLVVGLSRVGMRLANGLPLAALVGVQGFRLPLELIMHRAYSEGLMPEQMSYSGLNFDILTGITAITVAALLLAGRAPLWLVRGWNVMGTLLLLNIVVISMLSTPTPLRVFMQEPANVWITHFPFVWLPAVMVAAALLGHILVFRRLRAERIQQSAGLRPPRSSAGSVALR